MRIDLDRWEEIFITITRNKTRSLLTAFGVFWGIFMLVALMGGGQGLQDMMSANFKGFATNSVFFGSNKTSEAYKGFRKGRYWDMEFNDVERIRQAVPEVEVITPNISRWGSTAIFGTYPPSRTGSRSYHSQYQPMGLYCYFRRQEKLLCRQRVTA